MPHIHSHMVRQKEYHIGRARRRRFRRLNILRFVLEEDLSVEIQIKAFKRAKKSGVDLRHMHTRAQSIQLCVFNINSYSECQSLREYCFRKQDVGRICQLMEWTAGRTACNRYSCSAMTACCIVLRRLACPSTWYELETIFGMHTSALSEVSWEALEKFIVAKGYLVTTFQESFLESRSELYATAIKDAGAALGSCVGFIDCTKIKISRPGGSGANERSCYSGHKRFPCLIDQTITTPDGLMFSLYGPEVGRRHDLTLLRNSGVSDNLQSCLHIGGRQFYVYGDPAYMLRPWLQTGYERLNASTEQAAFNTAMSGLRVSVEWNYKDLEQIWTRNDFTRILKVTRFPVSLLYIASFLLLNFKTCIENWGQAGKCFKCKAPTFEECVNM